jgi:hypothetical protein
VQEVLTRALLLALIQRSAWNKNSANFAFWDFSEVRFNGVLGSSLPTSTKSVSNNSTLGGGCAQYLMVAILDAQEPEV